MRLSRAERREQLMAATVEVLALRGFAATTAEEIAAHAGVSKGLVWHYFSDMNDLFEATARRTLVVFALAAGAAIDLSAPVPALIRSAIHAAAGLRHSHASERRAMREIVQNLRTASGELRFGHADLDELYSAQEAIFSRGQAEGDVRSDLDPRLLAITYQGAVDTMLGYLDTYPDMDADAYADTVADILLGGFARLDPR